MKKSDKYVDENLIYIFENTTPYQRMLWLKRAIEFWKIFKNKQKIKHGIIK
ncbi:MAG: hypothetical protein HYT20_00180 [Candidatus Nealsonbacteria bacterium]|nr:hypothetical protein [Candidatus Nealsonbacteria bacterium]